jgi:hypothetical protein
MAYETGPLGNLYQAQTDLVDKGSRSAWVAGLYHFTVKPSNLKEGDEPPATGEPPEKVDIGFHYVAADSNGNALDSDGDGLSDYLDPDSDGDGLPDSWEWQYFLTLSSGSEDDPDGDLLSNSEEYLWYTSPVNAHTINPTKTDAEYQLTAIADELGTRVSLDVYADYDPQGDVTYLDFMVWVTADFDWYDMFLYDSSAQYWRNTWASYDHSEPWGGGYIDFYTGAYPGDVRSASFGAFHRADFDYDGLHDGFEIMVASSVSGNPDTDSNGLADGDEDLDQDGLSQAQEALYGTNPTVPETNDDTDGDGLPDWLEDYLRRRRGLANAAPWTDTDGDGVPNTVEFDMGSDPAIPDFGAAFPRPPLEAAEFFSFDLTAVPYSSEDGPLGNPDFPTAGLAVGALGVTVGVSVNPSDFGGPGVADVSLDIGRLNHYIYVWPFTDDGDPEQGELQKPDSLDGQLYRQIMLKGTRLLANEKIWARVRPEILALLRNRTLEHVSAVSMMKISYYCREIQWMNYIMITQGQQYPGLMLRIQNRMCLIHTEITRITAIHTVYVDRYPNLNYVSKVLKGVTWFSFGYSLATGFGDFRNYVSDYQRDVRNHQDLGAAALLSVKAQQLITSIPKMPTWVKVALSPTVPYFDPCPLGEYEGGGDCPYY